MSHVSLLDGHDDDDEIIVPMEKELKETKEENSNGTSIKI